MRGYLSVKALLMAPKLTYNQCKVYVTCNVKDGLSLLGLNKMKGTTSKNEMIKKEKKNQICRKGFSYIGSQNVFNKQTRDLQEK